MESKEGNTVNARATQYKFYTTYKDVNSWNETALYYFLYACSINHLEEKRNNY